MRCSGTEAARCSATSKFHKEQNITKVVVIKISHQITTTFHHLKRNSLSNFDKWSPTQFHKRLVHNCLPRFRGFPRLEFVETWFMPCSFEQKFKSNRHTSLIRDNASSEASFCQSQHRGRSLKRDQRSSFTPVPPGWSSHLSYHAHSRMQICTCETPVLLPVLVRLCASSPPPPPVRQPLHSTHNFSLLSPACRTSLQTERMFLA